MYGTSIKEGMEVLYKNKVWKVTKVTTTPSAICCNPSPNYYVTLKREGRTVKLDDIVNNFDFEPVKSV